LAKACAAASVARSFSGSACMMVAAADRNVTLGGRV